MKKGDRVKIKGEYIGPLNFKYKKGDEGEYLGGIDFKMYDGDSQVCPGEKKRNKIFRVVKEKEVVKKERKSVALKIGDWLKVLEEDVISCGYKKGHVGIVQEIDSSYCRVGPKTMGNWVPIKRLKKVRKPKNV